MNIKTLRNNTRAGRWIKQLAGPEHFTSFIPAPLPPAPPIHYDARLQDLEERANWALGRLEGVSVLLPDPHLFLYTYVRKEAVLSSQIEGTQSSLSDLLLFENKEIPGVPLIDVQEVSNYVATMNHGLSRLQNGFPLSLRLLKEIHALLLKGTRGSEKEPGEFRRSQNWIGGSRPSNAFFVPPPPYEVLPAMGALEKFLHNDPVATPPLIKAGLAHAQFETIHPFLDGNGRVGRLLITFILCAEGALSQPLLYLSLFLKQHRTEYYDALQRIRTEGDWEGWLAFYLTGVKEVSEQATETARKLITMFEQHRQQIQHIGKAAGSALRVHELLKKRVILSLPVAQTELHLSFPAVNKAMANLQKLRLVREFTGKQRNRLFCYESYLKVLDEGAKQPT
ncbi:MAG TPA: Fic family protein [Candidatus Brocadiia bacterium]|nr:Fic family protein [Candidatus Brocadiales bacterium]